MNIVYGLPGAIITALAVYATVDFIDRKKDLALSRNKRGLIISKSVILTLVLSGLFIMLYYGVPSQERTLPELLLTTLINYGCAVVTITDWKKGIIYNTFLKIILLAAVAIVSIAIVLDTAKYFTVLGNSIVGALFSGIVFLLCYIFSGKRLGAGDVKLAFVIGFCVGAVYVFGCIFYGVILCGVYSLIQILRKKITVKDGVPMGPFLYFGMIITYSIMLGV